MQNRNAGIQCAECLQPFPNLFTAIFQVALLGHSILKIQKIGSGTDTRYNIMTARFVMYIMGQSSPTYF
jgi:hypothetical protein